MFRMFSNMKEKGLKQSLTDFNSAANKFLTEKKDALAVAGAFAAVWSGACNLMGLLGGDVGYYLAEDYLYCPKDPMVSLLLFASGSALIVNYVVQSCQASEEEKNTTGMRKSR